MPTLFVPLALACSSLASGDEAVVKLPFGTVHGNLLEEAREFLSIPYASKPERFAAAMPWVERYPGGRLDAHKYAAQCWANPDLQQNPDVPFSEDCLFLNVYTPHKVAAEQKWPVMLWIHGGSFTSGTAMLPIYNGSDLAGTQDVVVVPVNYRVNVFGFAAVPEGQALVGANVGLQDQREAMRWVQKNIGAFRGDPAKVTIFGESAGGTSVGYHFLNGRLRDGLFHRAIMQSPNFFLAPLEDVTDDLAKFAETLGCADKGLLPCLRGVSAQALLNVSHGKIPGGAPIVDGTLIEAPPMDVIAAGNFSDVPVVIGNNAEEGNLWVYPPVVDDFGGLSSVTAEDLVCGANLTWSEEVATRVLRLYPSVASHGVDNRRALAEMLSDAMFHCDNRRIARGLSAAGTHLWAYSWKHAPSCNQVWPGAFHGSEVASVFGHPFVGMFAVDAPACDVVPEEQALADAVAGLWAAFARDGSMEERWPRFRSPAREVGLKLDLGLLAAADTETGYRRGQCDIVDELGLDIAQAYTWVAMTSYCQHARSSFTDEAGHVSV